MLEIDIDITPVIVSKPGYVPKTRHGNCFKIYNENQYHQKLIDIPYYYFNPIPTRVLENQDTLGGGVNFTPLTPL